MHRLFAAICPPTTIRRALLDRMGGISGARWQIDDQLHLTIRFIGEVDRHATQDILAALGGVHHPRFKIALNGIGAFDRRGRPEAVWAGVTPHAPLKALHKKVDQAHGSGSRQTSGLICLTSLWRASIAPPGPFAI